MNQKFYVAAFLIFFLLGYLVAELKKWMDAELPTQREIKRRMRKPRPRAK